MTLLKLTRLTFAISGSQTTRRKIFTQLVGLFLVAFFASALPRTVQGQKPDEPGAPRLPLQPSIVQGVVLEYFLNPDGLVEGLILSNKMIIRFPPHLNQILTEAVSPNDAVRIEGFLEGPGMLRASSIIDLQSQRSIVDRPPPTNDHSPPRKPGSQRRQKMTDSGTIQILIHGQKGEVNGVVLSDGMIIHFMPAIGSKFTSLLQVGNLFAAAGEGTSNDKGRCFVATSIGSSIRQLETLNRDLTPPNPIGSAP